MAPSNDQIVPAVVSACGISEAVPSQILIVQVKGISCNPKMPKVWESTLGSKRLHNCGKPPMWYREINYTVVNSKL